VRAGLGYSGQITWAKNMSVGLSQKQVLNSRHCHLELTMLSRYQPTSPQLVVTSCIYPIL
jgi:hypothetical protein